MKMTIATTEVLTLREVADVLKVTERTIYTMATKRELPAFRVGGQWRLRRVDLDAWIARAARAGVGLYSSAPYYAKPQGRAGLLFGYASLSEAEIRAGIRLLAEIAPHPTNFSSSMLR